MGIGRAKSRLKSSTTSLVTASAGAGMPPGSIGKCDGARKPVIDADGGDSLPPVSAAIGHELDGDRRVAPVSLTLKRRMYAVGHQRAGPPGRRSREKLRIA